MISPPLPNVNPGQRMAAGGVPALGEDVPTRGDTWQPEAYQPSGKSRKAQAARATHGSRRRTSPEVCTCSAEAKGGKAAQR
eukprot:12475568-Alexandrium_andersonii.AAC.1